MITIIDYGAGNLKSVEKALRFLGHEARVTDDCGAIAAAEKLILPGVGSFGNAMEKLKRKGLDRLLREVSVPLLGICLGLQLLFNYSEESDCAGLGLLRGNIVKIPDTGLKIPQIGWNSLRVKGGRLLDGVADGSYVYFVHSYYLEAGEKSIVSATVDYGAPLDVAVERGNLFAAQFHPEKSGAVGLKILENFARI
ncbi:MAG: imidazole glycerol phosphate synthase subunit HisH [Clostridiales bacterium]|jgi:glutamine amidotransferase|nr:imidazole glycerol phosphate synthase subunit HisH [Clostridiales bacterium]